MYLKGFSNFLQLALALLFVPFIPQGFAQTTTAIQRVENIEPQFETLVLHDTATDRYFYLKKKASKPFPKSLLPAPVDELFEWQETSLDEIQKNISGPAGIYVFPKGQVHVTTDRNAIEFRKGSGGAWVKIFNVSKSSGQKIHQVFFDNKDNLHMVYDRDHRHSGSSRYAQIHVKPKLFHESAMNSNFIAPVDVQESQFVPNPYGAGFLLRFEDGAVSWAKPVLRFRSVSDVVGSNCTLKAVLPMGSAKSLVHALENLFVLNDDGVHLLKLSGRLKTLSLPDGVASARTLELVSSYSFKPGEPSLEAANGQEVRDSTPTALADSTAQNGALTKQQKLDLFFDHLETMKQKLGEVVLDQPRLVEALVNLYQQQKLADTPKDRVKALIAVSVPNSGTSYAVQEFARLVFGDRAKERVKELDLSQFASKENTSTQMGRLIGFPPGTQSQQEFKGELPDFLRRIQHKPNMIVFKNFDKASPEVIKVLEGMKSSGFLKSGDGQQDPVGDSIWVLTSSKGVEKIFPPESKIETSEDVLKLVGRYDAEEIKAIFLQPDSSNLNDYTRVLDRNFLSNIDSAVAVGPLSKDSAYTVAVREIERLSASFFEKYEVQIDFNPSLVRYLVNTFFIPENGVAALHQEANHLMAEAVKILRKNREKGLSQVELSFEDFSQIRQPSKILVQNKEQGFLVELKAKIKDGDAVAYFSIPENREQLRNYEKEMSEIVFGQEEAIQMVAERIRVQRMNPSLPRPPSFLLLGPPAVGKTELASRGVAKVVFGDESRVEKLDMGDITDVHDQANIFNPAKGMAGSETQSRLEAIYEKYPDGCVIVMDEIGNMGVTPAIKQKLLMRYYPWLDSGLVEIRGKKVDFRKFVIAMTSNEMQEVFDGLKSDDLRMAQYRHYNQKELLQEALIKNHAWPAPLVSRLEGNIALLKPAVAIQRLRIARKLFTEETQSLLKDHRLGKDTLETSEGFFQTLGDSFFSHTQGARAIRAAAVAVKELLSKAILDAYELSPELLATMKLSLELTDNYSGKFTYRGDTKPERAVILSVKNSVTGEVYVKDLSSNASSLQSLASHSTIQRVSAHEAGHAIVNDPLITGEKLQWITVNTVDAAGYARYEKVSGDGVHTRQYIVVQIGRLLAGRMGEVMLGFEPSQGWQNDKITAYELAKKAVVQDGLVDDPIFAASMSNKDQENSIDVRSKIDAEITKLMKEGQAYAEKAFEQKWMLFRLLAATLERVGTLNGADFQKLIARSESPEFQAKYAEISKKHWAQIRAQGCRGPLVPGDRGKTQ